MPANQVCTRRLETEQWDRLRAGTHPRCRLSPLLPRLLPIDLRNVEKCRFTWTFVATTNHFVDSPQLHHHICPDQGICGKLDGGNPPSLNRTVVQVTGL